jgi:hypothetical protein
VSSERLDASSERLDASSERLDASSERLDASSERLDASSERLDVSSECSDASSEWLKIKIKTSYFLCFLWQIGQKTLFFSHFVEKRKYLYALFFVIPGSLRNNVPKILNSIHYTQLFLKAKITSYIL